MINNYNDIVLLNCKATKIDHVFTKLTVPSELLYYKCSQTIT